MTKDTPPPPANAEQMASSSFQLAVLDQDFLMSEPMRGVRFMLEYSKAEILLHRARIRSTIVVFGSARFREDGAPQQAHWYAEARKFGRIASQLGGALCAEGGKHYSGDLLEPYREHIQTRMLHGQTRYCVPSAFLDELPAALLRQVNPRPKSWDGGAPSSSASRKVNVSAYEAPSIGGLKVGQNVSHAKFGQGVIVAAEGRGADARVQVNFGAAGMKWLLLEYAKLTPA